MCIEHRNVCVLKREQNGHGLYMQISIFTTILSLLIIYTHSSVKYIYNIVYSAFFSGRWKNF